MTLDKDLRFALRQLRSHPGFTSVVLLTLGLCIGANTAIYSVLDAVLLRPLPYPQPDRLALLVTANLTHDSGDVNDRQTGALFEAVRRATPGLDVAADAGQNSVNFLYNGSPALVQEQRVSAGYFHVLGVAPWMGREFTRQDDVPHGPARVVISYDFWRHTMHSDRDVVGRDITLRGEPYRVIGVMPEAFRSPERSSLSQVSRPPVDVWTPLRPTADGEGGGSNYRVIARLKPGYSWPEVTGQLQALSRGLMEMPNFPRETRFFEERIIPLQGALARDSRQSLLLTWGAVLLVLLIGCVNIASLLMARAPSRVREIATRMAIGSSRAAIVRQLLMESLILALAGCGIGLLCGAYAADWLRQLGAVNFEVAHRIQLDGRVMAAMALLAVITSLVFGLLPALQVSRINIRAVLVESGRGIATGRNRMRSALVASEVALSLVLLVSAGLLLRTLEHFSSLRPGFDSHNLVVAETSLLDARYSSYDAVVHLYSEGLARIGSIPGVKSAAVALSLPYERPLNFGYRQLDGFSGAPPQSALAETIYVTPGYFETLGIPMLEGRTLRESDTAESAPVVIVSQSFARAAFGSAAKAIGHHVQLSTRAAREIVGVASDVQQHSGISGDAGPIAIEPTIYLPVGQTNIGWLNLVHVWFSPKWVVRTNVSPASLAPKIQSAIAAVDPQLPISNFRTMQDISGLYLREQRYTAALFSMLAGLGLVLAAIGLYGLISNSIAQRTHELGVRFALGATAWQIIGPTVWPALQLSLLGVAAGAILARVCTRLLSSMLWGVQPGDPLTFLSMAGLLLLIAGIASVVPCLRVLKMDPASTLRAD
ncbi:MAG TPA: ABC transporter permease [Bryobacteraceae bacterium]|nr:ABC transporter permease [Bryobacteraceae bacterium]